jgi:hypothetical protein
VLLAGWPDVDEEREYQQHKLQALVLNVSGCWRGGRRAGVAGAAQACALAARVPRHAC